MKVIRFGAAALTTLTAILLASCQSEKLEEFGTVPAAIVSPSFIQLLRVSNLLASAPSPVSAQQSPATSGPDQNASSDIPLPDGEGRDTAKKVCGKCHGSDIWAKKRYTRDHWSAVIDDMTTRGMNASDKDLDIILDYLSDHLAPEKKDAPVPPSPSQ